MKLLRTLAIGGVLGTVGYWLLRYLRPERSTLVLNNAVVVITGASASIGRAYANAFARRGARIVLAARHAETLEEVRHEIALYAADVLVVPTDVTDDDQIAHLLKTTLEKFGRIDVLISNAGLVEWGMLLNHEVEDIRKLVNTNLASTMCLTRLALPIMLKQGSGYIVNVSSVSGRYPNTIQPVYSPTKSGIVAFSDAMRRQLEGTGIHVMSVLPGFTDTEMVPSVMQDKLRELGITVFSAAYIAERTIDGLLKDQHELLLVDGTLRIGIWLERHFPLLSSITQRFIFTPDFIAAVEGIKTR